MQTPDGTTLEPGQAGMTTQLFQGDESGVTNTSSTSFRNDAGEPEAQPDPDFRLQGGYGNPMVDAAMPLFALVIRLRTADEPDDLAVVQARVRTQIADLLEGLRQHRYEATHLLAYSYALCLHVDEAVMNRPWGKNSCWSHEPLLSIFHHETWGGEKVFTVLSRMMQEPQRYKDVLEFMYLCLCLGLKGKYAIAPKGDATLQALIDKLYRMIRELRGPLPDHLCEPLDAVAPRKQRIKRQWPWWSPLAACMAALVAAYCAYSYRLQSATAEVLRTLHGTLLP